MPDKETIIKIIEDNLKNIDHKISNKDLQLIADKLKNYSCSDIKVYIDCMINMKIKKQID